MKCNKKAYVNISHLVNSYQSHQKEVRGDEKKDLRNQNRPQNQHYSDDPKCKHNKENAKSHLNTTRRVSLKLDFSGSAIKAESTFPNVKQISPIYQSSQKRLKPLSQIAESSRQKFKQLQSLMVSDKMFIDPERWQTFLERSKCDQRFHKALSAFTYSYFIQNYQ